MPNDLKNKSVTELELLLDMLETDDGLDSDGRRANAERRSEIQRVLDEKRKEVTAA